MSTHRRPTLPDLTVSTGFEGGIGDVVSIDQAKRSVTIRIPEGAGWKTKFSNFALPEEARRWAVPLGRFGYIARGLLIFEIGAFLTFSALRADAREAKGLAGSLRFLQQQPYGWALLAQAAAGLFAFGAFMLAAARYRKIQTGAVREAARKTLSSPNPIGA